MKIKHIRLHNFRNFQLAETKLDANSVWIYGANAQGKTNALEAIGLLGALRSFRTSKTSNLISYGKSKAEILLEIEHENLGANSILIQIDQKSTKVFVNENKERKLADFIGTFPTIVLSSDDIKLVRGAPLERRKFIDLSLSSIDSEYFDSLRKYHTAITQRNVLLKQENAAPESFAAFESEMAKAAKIISEKRQNYLGLMADIASQKYAILSAEKESANIRLKPSLKFTDVSEFLKNLEDERPRDIIYGSTNSGPHKDDIVITLNNKNVKEFASEGQQRSIVISLKLAQYELFKKYKNARPIILCDDILGELDEARRAAFWASVDENAQVIASSTHSHPQDAKSCRQWIFVNVENGNLILQS